MSKKPFLSDKNRIPYASRLELAIAIALGCLNIIIFALLAEFVNSVNPIFFAIPLIALFLVEIAIIISCLKQTYTIS